MKDIYLEKNYGRLYEAIEGGVCEVFEFSGAFGSVRHMFIKREIFPRIGGKKYYDIVTPYGYGGPVITDCEEGQRGAMVEDFEEAFAEYCRSEGIVSEYVRFHPLLSNAHDFSTCYDIFFRRKTTGTNVRDFAEPVEEEFSRSARKKARKAMNKGVEYRLTLNPGSLQGFKELYYQTMSKNGADEVYYFDDDYFLKCLEYFGKNLLLVEAVYEGQVIGMMLNFVYGDTVHIHLIGSLEEYLRLSPVYLMLYGLTLWAKENGIALIHIGGGRGSDPDDKLYTFKKRFGQNTEFDFFVGHKIWNESIYRQLCKAYGVSGGGSFFPAYRQSRARAAYTAASSSQALQA